MEKFKKHKNGRSQKRAKIDRLPVEKRLRLVQVYIRKNHSITACLMYNRR